MASADPISLIESLDPSELRSRLELLDRQQSALRVLLRAALARQRLSAGQAEGPGSTQASQKERTVPRQLGAPTGRD